MPIRVVCPACGRVVNAPDKAAGRTGKCPNCAAAISIPRLPSAPLPPAPGQPPAPTPTTSKPAPEQFDVEVEEDTGFDVEVESPVVAPSSSSPPVVVIPVTASPSPQPLSDPFASFGPPPDSVAARLSFADPLTLSDTTESSDSATPPGDPMHPGWKAVQAGLGTLRRALILTFAVVLILGVASGYSLIAKIDLITLGIAGLGVVVLLIALGIQIAGLIQCGRAPSEADGGPGAQLAQFALYATIAGLVLAPCGIGALALLALPYLVGFFLRAVGTSLPSPPLAAAAMRYMIAVTAAVVVTIILQIAQVVLIPVLVNQKVSNSMVLTVFIAIAVLIFMLQCVALGMYWLALGQGITDIGKQLKLRGVGQETTDEPKSKSRASRRRTASPARSDEDDFNPFAN